MASIRNMRTKPRRRTGTPTNSQRTHGGGANFSGSSENSSSGESPTVGGSAIERVERRATPEEATLTAKNYRLAKELSELRAKHKDETRLVTKLKMENMNLNTRCRQAVQHVEMLRRELATYKKTYGIKDAASASATSESSKVFDSLFPPSFLQSLQQPQDQSTLSPRYSTPNSAQGSLKPEQNSILASSEKASSEKGRPNSQPKHRRKDSPIDKIDDQYSLPIPSRKSSGNKNKNKTPTLSTTWDDVDGEEGPEDEAFGELHSNDFFHNSYHSPLPVTPEKDTEISSNNASNMEGFEDFNNSDSKTNKSNQGEVNSSIDAFEASFSSPFPSFSTDTPSKSPDGFPDADFADPFFLGTSEYRSSRKSRSPDDQNVNQDVRLNSPATNSRSDGYSPSTDTNHDIIMDDDKKIENDVSLNLFPESALSSFENISLEHVSTPPTTKKGKKRSPGSAHKSDDDFISSPPPTPREKTGVAAARAKYEAALGNKVQDENVDKHKPKNIDHNPSLVLKRLQQRKAKEKATNETGQENNISLNDEIRQLDSIAMNSTSNDLPTQEGSFSKRRNVKQPISYTEPSLSTKLRRGDVYFPKKELNEGEFSNSRSSRPLNEIKVFDA